MTTDLASTGKLGEVDTAAAIENMAQAFKDLAKGEQTASAVENQLDALEQKIDALLASVNDSTDSHGHLSDTPTGQGKGRETNDQER